MIKTMSNYAMNYRSIISLPLKALFLLVLFSLGSVNSVYAQNHPDLSGKVTDVIATPGFTYAEVATTQGKVWAAAIGSIAINKGDTVSFEANMAMENYHSKNLNRDFALIYFVKQFNTDEAAQINDTLIEQINKKQSIAPAVSKLLSSTREVKLGENLREAVMDGLQGKQKNLSDFQGKPLIINVWASWCGPCRAEMGSLERLSNKYNGKAFNIIGISTDDYRDDAVSAIKQSRISFDNFIDHKLELEKMLGANTIPLTVLVDDQGKVLKKIRGAREWDEPIMLGEISEVFNIKLQP
jgi:thiol-disulfide isomerase/thioredoxin